MVPLIHENGAVPVPTALTLIEPEQIEPHFTLSRLASDFLISQKVVRIVCNPGGGLGNYKASFSVMRQLRKLGFTGKFDLCFHDLPKSPVERFSKIKLFLPQIDEQNLEVQLLAHPELGEIVFRNLPYQDFAHQIPFVQVAITGADHGFSGHVPLFTPKTILYNVGQYIRLNPSGWPTLNTIDFFTMDKTIVLPPDATLATDTALAFSVQSDSLLNVELARAFTSMWQQQAENRLKVILAYGLQHDPDQKWICPALEISRLISGMITATPGSAVVIIVPYNFSMVRCSEVNLSTQADIYTKSDFSALNSRMKKRPSGKPMLVFTGHLPEVYFDALAAQAWLVLAEGCNLIAQREAAGLPYLHGGRQLTELSKLSSTASPILLGVEHLHQRANHYLENTRSSNHRALVKFLSLLYAKDEAMTAYFLARREVYEKKPDLVVTSLAIVSLIQTETIQIDFLHKLLQLLYTQQHNKELTKPCACYHSNSALMRLKWLHLAHPTESSWRDYYFYFLGVITNHYMEKALTSSHTAPASFEEDYLPEIISDYVDDTNHNLAFTDWATAQYQRRQMQVTQAREINPSLEQADRPASPLAITALWDHLRFITPVISSAQALTLPISLGAPGPIIPTTILVR